MRLTHQLAVNDGALFLAQIFMQARLNLASELDAFFDAFNKFLFNPAISFNVFVGVFLSIPVFSALIAATMVVVGVAIILASN